VTKLALIATTLEYPNSTTMLKSFLLSVLSFSFALVLYSQTCPGNYTFTSQADVDAFVTANTGTGCNAVSFLNIGNSTTDITDISGLNFLEVITGNFQIRNNPMLPNLNGLENITRVGSSFTVLNNDMLINLDELNGLTVVGSNLTITQNDNLQSLTGTEQLNYVLGNISISNSGSEVPNGVDNCPDVSNIDQTDTDNDGVGDACDNCPTVANANQADADSDGIGDDCESIAGNTSGFVGIDVTDPKSKLEIANGDIYIDNIHRGIIVRSATGKCFRIQPNESGDLISKEIDCPN